MIATDLDNKSGWQQAYLWIARSLNLFPSALETLRNSKDAVRINKEERRIAIGDCQEVFVRA